MVKSVVDIFTMIFVLVGIYLFIANGDKTVAVIQTLASNATMGIKTLQGR